MKKMLKLTAVLVVSVALSATAFAATDGTLGTTSQGTTDISVTVGEMVRISDLEDFAFGSYAGTGDLDSNDDLCVYRNGGALYTITATSNEGAFTVKDGADSIAYSVQFNDQTGTNGEVSLTYNTASGTQSGANTQSANCATGGKSANVHIVLTEAAVQAAPPGSYTGTLILTAAPV